MPQDWADADHGVRKRSSTRKGYSEDAGGMVDREEKRGKTGAEQHERKLQENGGCSDISHGTPSLDSGLSAARNGTVRQFHGFFDSGTVARHIL